MRSHRGVALVTVLLIVAIAALASTALLSASSLAIHRTAALRDTEQAWWLAWSGQSFAMEVLMADLKLGNPNMDSLDEAWATPVQFPVDQGGIRGQIVDQQGRINLNNLASTSDPTQQATADQLLWLMVNVLDIKNGAELVPAIRDWIDANDMPLPGGAEDSTYLGLDPPYRAANRPMGAISELLQVQGMTPEAYRKLRPFVTALPQDTKINVNTAPVQVLMALCSQPDMGAIQAFEQGRTQKGAPAGTGPVARGDEYVTRANCSAELRNDHVSAESAFFRVEGEAFIGSSRVALYSLIHRDKTKPPKVLSFSTDGD